MIGLLPIQTESSRNSGAIITINGILEQEIEFKIKEQFDTVMTNLTLWWPITPCTNTFLMNAAQGTSIINEKSGMYFPLGSTQNVQQGK